MNLDHIAEPLRPLAIPVAELNEDPANVMTHGPENIDAIRASLTRFGQRLPVVVQKQGMIVRAGNGRLRVARELGWSHVAAVVVDESDTTATAFAIADNRTAELADWDDDALARTLQALQVDAPDLLDVTGFDLADIDELLGESAIPPELPPDELPETAAEPVAKLGDLWQLGRHRVLCGDAHEDLGRLPSDAVVLATDPPYGISHPTDYSSRGRDQLAACRDYPAVHGDGEPFDPEPLLGLGLPSILWGGNHYASRLPDSGGWLVWDKERPPDLDQATCELAWTNCVKGVRIIRHLWHGMIRKGDEDLVHPTQKPVAVIAWSLGLRWIPEGPMLDPYLGSGTTLLAAESLGRTCYGVEIEPRYVDVIVARWESLTGEKAELVE